MDKKQLINSIDYFLDVYFPHRIIERGMNYFYNGNVIDLQLQNEFFLATVQGTTNYQVSIDVENLPLSSCTCPYENHCKHIVAVLCELKNFIEEAHTSIYLSKASELPFHSPDAVKEQLQVDLSPYIDHIYQILSKKGHYNNDQSGYLVKQFFEQLESISIDRIDKLKIIAMTVVLDQLLKKAVDFNTYSFRQNRFLAFFNELISQGYSSLKNEAKKANVPFYDWYTHLLLDKLTSNKLETPYEKLATTWLLCEETETVLAQHAEHLLSSDKKSDLFIQKLASLLYLQANDGANSLSLLRELKPSLHHIELIDHFLLMEQKKEYTMMKHWFELFFPYEKPKQGTVLGNLYEEMLLETGSEEEKLTVVWKNWLNQSSFSSYQSRIKKSNQIEKKKILNFIIPQLQKDLHRPQTEAIYYQILTLEGLYEEAIDSLLTNKKDVFFLSPEIEKLLTIVMKQQPELLLPFYHQLVERLVQKKSRNHYEDAALYIKRLKTIYEVLHRQETYETYKKGLKQRFKTFRAFIQELNKID